MLRPVVLGVDSHFHILGTNNNKLLVLDISFLQTYYKYYILLEVG